jgi:CRISPR-associated protein Cas2
MPDRLHLVAYDVTCPRRLVRARKAATAWAHGGQRSVWECWASPRDRTALRTAMLAPLDLRQDRLALFDLPAGGPFIALGRGAIPQRASMIYVG